MKKTYIIIFLASILLVNLTCYSQSNNHFRPSSTPITNLNSSVSGSSVVLSWDAPIGSGPSVLLQEGFENVAPVGWLVFDADDDGNKWEFGAIGAEYVHSGVSCVFSFSLYPSPDQGLIPYDPDNYFISPALDLPEGGKLEFYAASQSPGSEDHYGVFLSSTNYFVSSFDSNPAFEEVASVAWNKKTVDLPAGTKHIAFRHYNSPGKSIIKIDDVLITTGGQDLSYSIYRDDINIANNISTTKFTDNNVSEGKHNYCVEVNYAGNIKSEKVCIDLDVLTNIEDVLDNKIIINGGNACINFDVETATELSIYDATGRLVSKTIKEGFSSDAYNPGLYIVKYSIANFSESVKVVVR